jgi:ABC-type branched-subunit amino acid transport system permease subunit
MRIFAVAADVAMGVCLGVFLYAVVSRTWPDLGQPYVAAAVLVASVLVVLFRRPGGSLEKWRRQRVNR